MTTMHEWPTQLRLPGQAAAHEGPVPMTVMYLMHHAFRRDLAAFAAAAHVTPADDRVTWQALADRWALFAHVLHEHHTGEDEGLWPFLMERADAAGRETLEAMEAEHAEIDPLLESCAAGFRVLAARPDEDARAALAVRLVATRESLARHLRHEENDAIALIQQLMTAEDWHRIDEEYFKKGKGGISFFAKVVPWVVHGLDPVTRRQGFADAGKPFEVLWWLTRRGFERRERAAFRYLDAGRVQG